jgi:predicted peroxiredoxin
MGKNLVILLWAADPDRPHLCATPFFHAAAAAAMDIEVEIYFTSKSVVLLKRGLAEGLFAGPRERATVYSFMQQAAQHGAKFFACSQALLEHCVSPDDLIPEVSGLAGAAAYIARCVDARWTALTY